MPIAVMIPTLNEEQNLPYALESCGFADQVFVLDSGSTDRTLDIARQLGAQVITHPWEGYARQKNWGLDNLPITQPWVFILDADESITPPLRDELMRIASANSCEQNGFYVNRHFIFEGRRIRHCGYYPSWNLRFFRHGKARYELREVHEHMVVEGKSGYLRGEMQHFDRRGLDWLIRKHEHYSALEARELFRIQKGLADGTLRFSFFGGPIQRRRWVKHCLWPRLPARWVLRFLYMYILRMGFLDGPQGLGLCRLLARYEWQISSKLRELQKAARHGVPLESLISGKPVPLKFGDDSKSEPPAVDPVKGQSA